MTERPKEPPPFDETRIAEEAARWLAVLANPTPDELARFADWARLSPRHIHYVLRTAALDQLLTRIDADRKFDVQALIRQAQGNVVPIKDSARPERAHFSRPRPVQLAATIVAAAVLAGWFTFTHEWGWREYSTAVGEQRAVELEDGSLIHLNTGTRLRVHLDRSTREIRLVKGEALFKVHRDSSRPFRVHSSDSVIQALGTQFNVYRRKNDTRVSVLEGAVRVMATSLTAGQGAEIEHDGRVNRLPPIEVVTAVAWRERRLNFRGAALNEVVTEFNRYNRTPRLRLDGIDGEDRHYSGTFDADDPEMLAGVLAKDYALRIDRTPGEIVIRAR